MFLVFVLTGFSYFDFTPATCEQFPHPKAVFPWHLFGDVWNEPEHVALPIGARPTWCDGGWPLSWIQYVPPKPKKRAQSELQVRIDSDRVRTKEIEYAAVRAAARSVLKLRPICENSTRWGLDNCLPAIYESAERAMSSCSALAKGPYRVKWEIRVRGNRAPGFHPSRILHAYRPRPVVDPKLTACLASAAARLFTDSIDCSRASWRAHSSRIQGKFALHTLYCRY